MMKERTIVSDDSNQKLFDTHIRKQLLATELKQYVGKMHLLAKEIEFVRAVFWDELYRCYPEFNDDQNLSISDNEDHNNLVVEINDKKESKDDQDSLGGMLRKMMGGG